MYKQLAAGALALASILSPAMGLTQDAKKADAPAADEIRRDPKGQKGISPFNEKLAEGRRAMAAKDYDAAIKSFEEGVQLAPDDMYGYLLLSQAKLVKSGADEAYKPLEQGAKKSGTEEVTANFLFLRAMVVELKAAPAPKVEEASKTSATEVLANMWEAVKEAWSAYGVYLTAHSKVPGYQATADERKKKVDEREARFKEWAPVRDRLTTEK